MALALDEKDSLFPREGQRRLLTPTITMDELVRAHARLPLDADDRQELLNGFATRMKAGWHLSPMPLEARLEEVSREAKRAFVEQTTPQGLAFVSSLDLKVSLLIVKTDAGRGFFGRQKASFTCFVTEGADGFERAGVVPTIPRAFGILDSLYQVVVAVDLALD